MGLDYLIHTRDYVSERVVRSAALGVGALTAGCNGVCGVAAEKTLDDLAQLVGVLSGYCIVKVIYHLVLSRNNPKAGDIEHYRARVAGDIEHYRAMTHND